MLLEFFFWNNEISSESIIDLIEYINWDPFQHTDPIFMKCSYWKMDENMYTEKVSSH